MDTTRNALGYKGELGGGEMIFFGLGFRVRWLELIAINIMCLSCQALVIYRV